jgi:hypothetical protein
MKKLLLSICVLLVLLSALLARAWTYNTGDLLLVFRESGHKNIEFDLGSVTNLLGKTNGYTTTITGWDAGLVTNEFGADLTGVKVVLLATSGSTNWLSGAEPDTTAYNVSSQASDTLQAIVNGIGTKPLYPINIPTAGTNAYVIDPGGQYTASSYDYIVTGGNPTSVNGSKTIPKLGGYAPFNVEQSAPGFLDFWSVQSTIIYPNSPPDNLVGTFTITTNGVLTFVAGPRASNITGVAYDGNASSVQFTTVVGNQYSVAYTNALGGAVANWPVATNTVVGDGRVKTISRNTSAGTEFYRVITQ